MPSPANCLEFEFLAQGRQKLPRNADCKNMDRRGKGGKHNVTSGNVNSSVLWDLLLLKVHSRPRCKLIVGATVLVEPLAGRGI